MITSKSKFLFQPTASACQKLEHLCAQFISGGESALDQEMLQFNQAYAALNEQISSFQAKISSVTLAMFIRQWARHVSRDAVYGARYIQHMSELIEKNIICLKNANQLVNPLNFGVEQHVAIIDSIRTYQEWTIPHLSAFEFYKKKCSLPCSNHSFSIDIFVLGDIELPSTVSIVLI